MIREKIISLFKEYDAEVQEVLSKVLEKEWEKLSMVNPRGIKDDIRVIIDAQARLSDDET
jgi:hypothetical protein